MTPAGLRFGAEAFDAARRWTFEPGKPGVFAMTMVFEPGPDEPVPSVSSLISIPTAEALPPAAQRIIQRTRLTYPQKALSKEISGFARLVLEVRSDGKVGRIWRVLDFPRDFDFARNGAAMAAKYLFKGGQPGLYRTDVHMRIEGKSEANLWEQFGRLPEPSHRIEPVFSNTKKRSKPLLLRLVAIVLEDGVMAEPITIDLVDPSGALPRRVDDDVPAGSSAALLLWRFKDVAPGLYRLDIPVPASP